MKDIAIIGAGMAGLSCAEALSEVGLSPILFDKGRGPGGRMATRRAEVSGETLHFDHGTQFFDAIDARFQAQLDIWAEAGFVASWPAVGTQAFVGTPSMNAPLKHMAGNHDVRWGQRIEDIRRENDRWHLSGEGIAHVCDAVIAAIPAEQCTTLLHKPAPEFANLAKAVVSDPCWAVMAVFETEPDLGDTFRGRDAIAWASRNSAKPGRRRTANWVIHASADWSREHLEREAEDAGEMLLAAFFAEAGVAPASTVHLAAHRWRYSTPNVQEGPEALWNSSLRLGVAGDWLIGPRVESAWLSGRKVADMLLST